jgi:hypothetical protein
MTLTSCWPLSNPRRLEFLVELIICWSVRCPDLLLNAFDYILSRGLGSGLHSIEILTYKCEIE